MKATTSYDQNLRVIGQALESRRINVCHIKCEGDTFAVRGAPETTGAWLGLLRKLQGLKREASGPPKQVTPPRTSTCLSAKAVPDAARRANSPIFTVCPASCAPSAHILTSSKRDYYSFTNTP